MLQIHCLLMFFICFSCSPPSARTIISMLDFRMLKSWSFIFYTISSFFIGICLMIPFVYIQDRAVQYETKINKSVWLLSTLGISMMIGRICCPLIPTFKTITPIRYCYINCIVGGLLMVIYGLYTDEIFQFFYAFVYGLTNCKFILYNKL